MTVCFLIRQRMVHSTSHERKTAIFFKCAATSMAAVLALLGCLEHGGAANWIIFAGIVIGTIADGVLCVHFTAGGVLFALGHVLYMIAFCIMKRPEGQSVLLLVVLMSATTAVFMRGRKRLGRRLPFFYAYALIIGMMVSIAASQTPLFFAGAVLFACSDALLLYRMIERRRGMLEYVSLGAYYLAQFLLAAAVAF